MLPGPIFRREVRAAGGGRMFSTRMAMAVTIAIFTLGPAWGAVVLFGDVLWGPGASAELRICGAFVFAAAICVEVLMLSLMAAGWAGASIAEEREKDTLPLLLLTRLTRLELAGVKLAGRLMPALREILVGLPLILAGAWIAGLPALVVAEALAMIASTAAAAGALGILASSRHDRAATAVGEASAWSMFWLVVTPMASLMPVRSGTLWGELLVELRRLAVWIAPSSPLSLVTDRSWFTGMADAPDLLSIRVATMLAMQAALVVAALAVAVAGLRLREPHPSATDPLRGCRPPVGDDPIYWREYELPMRGRRMPVLLLLALQLLAVLRALLVQALTAAVLAIAVALPIGMMIGACYFGYLAFGEAWGPPASSVRLHVERDTFNLYARGVTFVLGTMPMMTAAAGVAGQILIERQKKTWETLLTTPLTGPEILGTKLRVAATGIRTAARFLVPLWLLGIACGALHPAGVVLAAAGLATGNRLGMALGLRSAIRPGVSPQTAQSISAVWSLAMMLLGAATVVAPLCSAHDLERLRALDPRLPWLAGGVLAASTIAMAAWGRSLTRLCFERFDEWMDRPHRAGGEDVDPDSSPQRTQRKSDEGRISTDTKSPAGTRMADPGH